MQDLYAYDSGAACCLNLADNAIAISTLPCDQCLTRPCLAEQIAAWMAEAGMHTWTDEVANVHGRIKGQNNTAPALLIGSHYDTVKDAGQFDGALGILVGIAAIKALTLEVTQGPETYFCLKICMTFVLHQAQHMLTCKGDNSHAGFQHSLHCTHCTKRKHAVTQHMHPTMAAGSLVGTAV